MLALAPQELRMSVISCARVSPTAGAAPRAMRMTAPLRIGVPSAFVCRFGLAGPADEPQPASTVEVTISAAVVSSFFRSLMNNQPFLGTWSELSSLELED